MSTPDPEAPKLDPQPFEKDMGSFEGEPFVARSGNECGGWPVVFKPRPEYSQRREDYPND